MAAFSRLGELVHQQKQAHESYDPKKTYGSSESGGDLQDDCLMLFINAYRDMKAGATTEELEKDEDIAWTLPLKFKDKSTLDTEVLYTALRKLSDRDLIKIRSFNRFVGQQLYSTTYEEFFELQESKVGVFVNPFYEKFTQQSATFAKQFQQNLQAPPWPKEILKGPDRDEFVKKVNDWRVGFRELPGIRIANSFFTEHPKDTFNTFFHLQRQFDSPNYKDLDEEKKPYPQPLPRIAAYRAAIEELQSEFTDLEGSVGMCFDYCKMSVEKVVGFVLSAEDTFLNITSRLDRDYPIEVDHVHQELHERAHDVKMMMFPLRCLFFDELEARRKTVDSNDNTLDSYMDMTLGKTEVHIPPAYEHQIQLEQLLPELQKQLTAMSSGKCPAQFETPQLISLIQELEHEALEQYAEIFSSLSDEYESTYKSDENNLNRRLARLAWLYLKAMSKKDIMADASRDRLNKIDEMASKYARHAERFAEVEIGPDTDLRSLSDDQLPLMASPQQMEDLFRTSHVVGKLSSSGGEFEDTAARITAGLQAALDMMQKAGELMEKMVNKMFPKKEDSKDLLDAIHHLIELGYRTQQALADLAKKEAISSRDKKAAEEAKALKQEVENCKLETTELQGHLRDVLTTKRELVEKMRITKGEKDHYHGQLRKITMMTINSIQAQNA